VKSFFALLGAGFMHGFLIYYYLVVKRLFEKLEKLHSWAQDNYSEVKKSNVNNQ